MVVVGAVASQCRVTVSLALLPAASVAVNCNTYVPSLEADTVVDKAVGLPKVIVPGPEALAQA